jgi:hypothetical protein
MRMQIQIGLRIAASLLLLLTLALIANPMNAHKVMSTGAYDNATHYLLAANFLGLSILMLVIAANPQKDTLGALAAALLIPGVVAGHQMLVSGNMPIDTYTVVSLIVFIAIAVFFLVARTQDLSESASISMAGAPPAPVERKAAPKKAAPKKAAPKKAAKKKAAPKKAAKKKARKKATKKRR